MTGRDKDSRHMSGHSGKLLRHTLLYAPAQFLPSLVQFATTVLWTHLLDPTAFGLAAFVLYTIR